MLPIKGFLLFETMVSLTLVSLFIMFGYSISRNLVNSQEKVIEDALIQLVIRDEHARYLAEETRQNRMLTISNKEIQIKYQNNLLVVSTETASQTLRLSP